MLDETIDVMLSLDLAIALDSFESLSRFNRSRAFFAVTNRFKDGTGDGVVSKRVIPSNKTCLLMASLSGSSLNMDGNTHTRLGNK